MYIFIGMYVYVCMYICIYVHTFIDLTLEKVCSNVMHARKHTCVFVCMHVYNESMKTHIIQHKSTINIAKQHCIPNNTSS